EVEMAQRFYWSADFLHNGKISRFGIEITFKDVSTQRNIMLSLIQSLASVGYIYKGNSTLEEIRDEKTVPN
ncbi:MAG TPA: hypothetical protein P5098_02185, partial [Candidatus Dojkabacteria bacterium]|nr:hypothetical protein [Candidatus Dojkabacteria bacterium]